MSTKSLSIKSNMLWNSVGSMIYLVCQWLITVLVVRLSPGYDAAGALALGMAVSNVFSPIGYFKIRPYQVSDVKGEYSAGQYVGLRIVTIGASLIVMIVYGVATCAPDSLAPVFLYGVYSCGPIAVDVLHGVDQKKLRMDIVGRSFIIRGVLSLIGFVALFYATGSLELALIAMILFTFAAIIFYDIPATKRIESEIVPDFSWYPIRSLLIACLPMVIAFFFCSAAPSIPRQFLSDMYGSSALGVYASVAAPVAIVQMGSQYIYSPVLGVFAEYFLSRDAKAFLTLLSKTTCAIIVVTIIAVVGFLLVGEQILVALYGEGISDYTYLLVPLVICTSITAFAWFLGDLMIVVRQLRANLVMYLISFAGTIFLSYPMLKLFGLNGASFALMLGFGIGLVYSAVHMVGCCRVMMKEREYRSPQ